MKLPSGPKTPVWLQYIQIATDPLGYLDATGKRYGDNFTIMFGSTPVVFVSNPEAIEKIFTSTKEITTPGELNRDMILTTGEQGILQLDGLRHKHRRKLLMPAFHGTRMQAHGQQICKLTEKAMSQQAIGKPFLAYPTVGAITLQVSIEIVLGLSEGERYEKFIKLLPAVLKSMQSPFILLCYSFPELQQDLGRWSPWGYFVGMLRELFQLVFAEVKERREQAANSCTNILSELLSARDEAGELMTNEEVRDLLLSPLFAADHASATAIAWTLYWIYRLPTVRDRLLEELDSLGESPDPMTIVRLPYLSAVCNEALRIYPTQLFTFPRRVESPIELMGYELSPGTTLTGNIYLTHQREDLYPEPKQFQPERFLQRQFSPYEFLPFGGGTRNCIGAAFAVFEMKLVVATILSRYQLALADRRPEQPKFEGLMCYPARGVKMVMLGQRQRQGQSQQFVAGSV
jgi:cytochrome P450